MSLLLSPGVAYAIEPQRSWLELVSSNGHTGVVVDLQQRRVHHFREHLFATEEPQWDENGYEVWLPTVFGGTCFKPQPVNSRDLLQDAYFGYRTAGTSRWLTELVVDLDASGYDAPAGATGNGGTGIVRMVQTDVALGLRFTTRVFAPWSYDSAGWVMALQVENIGSQTRAPVTLYGLVNPNLGYGRPGARQETGAQDEVLSRVPGDALLEQGFAGLVYMHPLPAPLSSVASTDGFFVHVRDNRVGPLPGSENALSIGNELAGAFEWVVPSLSRGESAWVAMVIAHDPNPFYGEGRVQYVRDWIDDRSAVELVAAERQDWADFLSETTPAGGLSADEQALWRHSAAVLRMAQVRETQYWVRDQRDQGSPRYTGVDLNAPLVPTGGTLRQHLGQGALLASLPPGEWAYAWVRDGSYGIVGMTDAGMFPQARLALEFFMNAHANRYIGYAELEDVPITDYALSLTRYHGFGIEESDTLCNGDFNFEWDGFGLYLWALRHYVDATGDVGFLETWWPVLKTRVADVIVGLIEPETGLLHPDSSIWEVHWLGKEKTFAYTSIVAARGLCDMASLADRMGDPVAADRYAQAGRALRASIAATLTTEDGAIASNLEELAAGSGYWDAAVVEAVAMGLFDPEGRIATATLSALRDNLTVPSGRGLARNDDQFDTHGLTPWGGPYDTLEWVFLNYRASIAARLAGDSAWADSIQQWVTDQSVLNYLLIGENYDENTGVYRNNAPMIGFGAGSFITAMLQRSDLAASADPACGMYWEDDPTYGPPPSTGDDADADVGTGDVGTGDVGTGDTISSDASDAPDVPDPPDTSDDAEVETPDVTAMDSSETDVPEPDGDEQDSDEQDSTGPDSLVSDTDDDVQVPDGEGSDGEGSDGEGDAELPQDTSRQDERDPSRLDVAVDVADTAGGGSASTSGGGGCAAAGGASPAATPLSAVLSLMVLTSSRRRRRWGA
jgi:hypothetical protein